MWVAALDAALAESCRSGLVTRAKDAGGYNKRDCVSTLEEQAQASLDQKRGVRS